MFLILTDHLLIPYPCPKKTLPARLPNKGFNNYEYFFDLPQIVFYGAQRGLHDHLHALAANGKNVR